MVDNNSNRLLEETLWKLADMLRGRMVVNDYRDYMIALVFYKYLSDKFLYRISEVLENSTENSTENLDTAQKLYEEAYQDESIKKELLEKVQRNFSYTIKPEWTFTAHVDSIHKGNFQIADLDKSFRSIEQANEGFKNIFEDVDLCSKKLGTTSKSQNKTISEMMKILSVLNMADYRENILGETVEYMIHQIASDLGKKSAEFYTPQFIAKLMAQIVLQGKENQKSLSVYDPTMGTGSLLLAVKKYYKEPEKITYYGQELNTRTYNLARMNFALHGIPIANQQLRNADTLISDWPTEQPTTFDVVLMNPPYSMRWSAEAEFLNDPRFSEYGVLPPKSKADFAFLLHGYHHLKDLGMMAVVLPHGILFRGGAEGKIRQKLLEDGAIDAIIGLPSNLFYNTAIPTALIVLKKNRPKKDILFIDASGDFEKDRNQNKLTNDHIQKIIDTYTKRENKKKYAHMASFEEIVENDYNLNIPRYVDTFEEDAPIPLETISADIQSTQQEIDMIEKELISTLSDIQGTSKDKNEDFQTFLKKFMDLKDGNE